MEDIWRKAVEKYTAENNITKGKLEDAGDFEGAGDGVQKATLLFKGSRHPKDRKDKVITAVGGCLDWIDTAVSFVQEHIEGTVRNFLSLPVALTKTQ